MDIHGKDCGVNFKIDDANMRDDVDLSKCHDIAIVGAGAGGTYSAYRLRNKNLNIAVYEQLDRVSGRLFTLDIPGNHRTYSVKYI